MNPLPDNSPSNSVVPTPKASAGFQVSSGLVASAVGLTILQAAAFFWLARFPGSTRTAVGIVAHQAGNRPGAAVETITLLAVDGLREEQNWLPNPRQFLNPQPGSSTPSPTHSVQMDLAVPNKSAPGEFLPVTSAPVPIPPTIPRPEFRPPTKETPRPVSPPTHSLALTNSQVSISGALQSRGLMRPIKVPSWSGPESLGVTRVEVSVNMEGEVVLARVVESGGLKAADQLFLAACRTIRFAAADKVPPGQEFSQLMRGRIALRWPAPP